MRQAIHPSVKTIANQIQIEANEMVELRKIFAELCAQQTGQLLDVVQNDLERDILISGKEAQEYGIIDKIVNDYRKGNGQ